MKLLLDGVPVEVTARGAAFALSLGEETFEVELLRLDAGWLELLINGRRVRAHVSADGAARWVTVAGRTFRLTRSSGGGGARAGRGAHPHASSLTAPMPGQVRAVNVSEGEAVRAGQTLVVVEAMKMELRVQSPRDGVVGRVLVRVGESVEREQVLLEVDEPKEPE